MQADDCGTLADVLKIAFEKTQSCIDAAQHLINFQDFDGAVNRAYYGIFWAVTCVHLLDGNHFKKHKESIGIFNRDYINAGIFPKDFGRRIHNVADARNDSDYNIYVKATEQTAKESLECAKELFDAVKIYCEGRINGNEGKKF